jgi:hypothetical protein
MDYECISRKINALITTLLDTYCSQTVLILVKQSFDNDIIRNEKGEQYESSNICSLSTHQQTTQNQLN